MKSYSLTLNKQLFNLFLIAIALSLLSCKEEDISIPPSTQAKSTLLADNKRTTQASLENFKNTRFQLNPSTLNVSGSRLFLKLSNENNEVLYLGEIDRYRIFSIVIQVRLDNTQLYYELFTNDDTDITQFGVIIL